MLWLLALVGVVTAAVALPLAVASAGQVDKAARRAMAEMPGDAVRPSGRASGSDGHTGNKGAAGSRRGAAGSGSGDSKVVSSGQSSGLLGLGLATAARCGPKLTSPGGIEAQTCVLTQGAETWARTYYRNATGDSLDSVLSLMGPGGRSVQMRCATSTDDEPATCETPREPSKGGMDAYTAVTEFASRGTDGALLLRSGSDSAGADGNSKAVKGS
ncbi:hypothetical protein BFF78_21655 [Streptomyces fodineus]|uniref:Serine/threonine protein kinase n=1 Tax=Streptomyces fodineus TaxID=1904616 RepID=A0A1D7YCT0_9ACTN|nr:hypothetical protein [Streptomyces fodineus]AOR33334.1 hypothetical protein BFF78_21655 [Streptomyces fodineus]